MRDDFSILHVTAEYGRHQTGGLGSFVSNLVASQRRYERAEIALVKDLCANELENGIFPCATFDQRAALLARHRSKPYDIFHFHDWHGWEFARELAENKVPIVVTCHLPCFRDSYYYEHTHKDSADAEAYLFHLAASIVGNSDFTKREILGKYPEHVAKCMTILNGIDTTHFFLDHTVVRDRELIFAAGRLVTQKGFEYFIEACAKTRQYVPGARFVLAGDGPLSKTLVAQVEDLGLSNIFTFLGRVDQSTLRNYYQSCAMIVIPSRYEPFGLVAAEAMACGSAVIASDVGGLREVVEHGDSGLIVKAGDIDGIGAAIIYLHAKERARTLLGRRAASSAAEKFSMARCEDDYRKLYLRMTNRCG